ncbi:YcaO-like family protein [Streptomyces sp. NPDC060027]|uniref:YcaO-like family protein n=1 Tax=Streptomyces sp. NPDC060027 TaxID=3347040 RepID=UPI0036B1A7D1
MPRVVHCPATEPGAPSRWQCYVSEGDVRPLEKQVTDGTHRAVPPHETWARVSPLLRTMGITRVSDLTGLDVIGIPVFQAVRPNAATLSVSQGKGITPELAKVSAVMESIETWHAENMRLPCLAASVAEMEPILPYSVRQLPMPPRSIVSSATRLQWVAGQPVCGTALVWIPRDCVLLDATGPGSLNSPPLLSSNSNGLASGNTVEEALLHGMYEVIERDARARAAEDRAGLRVDLGTVTAGRGAELLELFAAADIHVCVYDLTPMAVLPVYEAQIWSADLPIRFRGAGCHVDADVALCRALTEAAQSRLTMVAGTRDDMDAQAYGWVSSRARLRMPFVNGCPTRPFSGNRPALERACGLDEDLETVVDAVVEQTETGVFWVDLTRPEIGIPVVQVIAPGLTIQRDFR